VANLTRCVPGRGDGRISSDVDRGSRLQGVWRPLP
jgi:hypothetical protein